MFQHTIHKVWYLATHTLAHVVPFLLLLQLLLLFDPISQTILTELERQNNLFPNISIVSDSAANKLHSQNFALTLIKLSMLVDFYFAE